ncbi:hypothetical protein J3Q64DRAFT_1816860 [Phycomyces blakesleeanus]|uniref:Uncharacterized protein n=2 Tax=Phycomyces blakesleeanus TaxID=4837 RepID=A0A162Y0B0_PHYB8|nr:hypothetical protein PHYBLDRAFT_60666 [Phycomyces blakesleeanus NRRL 1555(-)]OAD77535.1 hypothetical protein PHYBLDRAFT_60666 [Phycomyces blakesleeanus NRRL 1555(-)]|eukprot:XP_018295575.1 hypothetical protein PHYBLDRAFT_60666 [Phycomyces blakesleeanus NRRL 1555(-)]
MRRGAMQGGYVPSLSISDKVTINNGLCFLVYFPLLLSFILCEARKRDYWDTLLILFYSVFVQGIKFLCFKATKICTITTFNTEKGGHSAYYFSSVVKLLFRHWYQCAQLGLKRPKHVLVTYSYPTANRVYENMVKRSKKNCIFPT